MTSQIIAPTRRSFLAGTAASIAGGTAIAATGFGSATASAAAPLAGAPMAGALRRKVGEMEVTALLDGYLDVSPDLIVGYDAAIDAQLKQEQFISSENHRIAINAFLVNTDDKLVLVDAGTSDKMGPTLGKLGGALAAAGVSPDQIDAVLITHMHPDHLFGVLTPDGKKAFPNAELILPEADYGFWFDDAAMGAAPEQFRPFFLGARQAADAYADAQTRISSDAEVLSGIRSVPLPGHTPGHTGYMISSGNDALFVIADAVHVSTLQMAHPEWGIAFDIDPGKAVETRKKVFDQAASDRVLVAGSHLPFPGFGHIGKAGAANRFVPAEWQYAY